MSDARNATANRPRAAAGSNSAHLRASTAHDAPADASEASLTLLTGTGTARAADAVDPDALARVFASALMADMPCQTTSVRALVGRAARHAALAVRFDARARELGFDTEDAIAMLRESDREDRRSEQLIGAAFALAERLLLKHPAAGGGAVIDVRAVDAAAEAAARRSRGRR